MLHFESLLAKAPIVDRIAAAEEIVWINPELGCAALNGTKPVSVRPLV